MPQEKKLTSYVVISANHEPRFFQADSDAEAERWVETEYDDADGAMILHRLTPVTEWQ